MQDEFLGNKSVLIKEVYALIGDSFKKTDMLLENGAISRLGHLNDKADIVIDAEKGHLIAIPGLINTHAHIAMSPLKGLVDDVPLEKFLEITSNFDSINTRELVYNSAIIGITEMMRNGITDFVDFYYYEDEVARAINDMGYQGNLAWVVLDKDKTTQKGDPIKNAEHFIKSNSVKRVRPMVAVQGVYAASRETIMAASELAEEYDTLTTMHIAETAYEVDEHRKNTKMRPVEWLNKLGFINKRLVAVHCVWLNGNEMKALSRSAGAVSYNPTSNMKLGSGKAPIKELLSNGANITLGTDSVASNNALDMFAEMKYGALFQSAESAGSIKAMQAFEFATKNASKVLYGNAAGIYVGARADIVLLKPPLNNANASQPKINDIVYSYNPSNVEATIVRGDVLYYNGFGGKIPKLYEKALRYTSRYVNKLQK